MLLATGVCRVGFRASRKAVELDEGRGHEVKGRRQ